MEFFISHLSKFKKGLGFQYQWGAHLGSLMQILCLSVEEVLPLSFAHHFPAAVHSSGFYQKGWERPAFGGRPWTEPDLAWEDTRVLWGCTCNGSLLLQTKGWERCKCFLDPEEGTGGNRASPQPSKRGLLCGGVKAEPGHWEEIGHQGAMSGSTEAPTRGKTSSNPLPARELQAIPSLELPASASPPACSRDPTGVQTPAVQIGGMRGRKREKAAATTPCLSSWLPALGAWGGLPLNED